MEDLIKARKRLRLVMAALAGLNSVVAVTAAILMGTFWVGIPVFFLVLGIRAAYILNKKFYINEVKIRDYPKSQRS